MSAENTVLMSLMKCVQVGESHVNGHRSNHAAAAETDGPGSSCLQCCLITTSGNNTLSHPKTGGRMEESFLLSLETDAGGYTAGK